MLYLFYNVYFIFDVLNYSSIYYLFMLKIIFVFLSRPKCEGSFEGQMCNIMVNKWGKPKLKLYTDPTDEIWMEILRDTAN